MIETYKDILGNIKSLPKLVLTAHGGERFWPENLLKKNVHGTGYLRTIIFKNQKPKNFLIHRLVAQAFIPNLDNKPCINHIDGNKQNNCIENLEWCTHSENSKHNYKIGLQIGRTNIKGMFNELNSRSKKVIQMSLNGEVIKTWPSLQEVNRQHKFHHANVGACARGVLKTAYGFKWQYVA